MKLRTTFLFMVFPLLILSCERRNDSSLANYTEDELIEILVDLTLARSSVSGWPASLADSVKMDHYRVISQLHDIEEKELYLILDQLSSRPDYFQKLLNIAADSLRLRNEMIDANE